MTTALGILVTVNIQNVLALILIHGADLGAFVQVLIDILA